MHQVESAILSALTILSLWCSPANMPAAHAGDHRSEAGQGRQSKPKNNGVSEYDNAKRSLKERRLIRHFLTFFDRHRYPHWELTDERIGWFLQLQEKGRKSLTPEQLYEIEPLIWCQKCKEITLQQLIDEMSEWWSKGWGWMYPLESTLNSTTERLMKVASYESIIGSKRTGFCPSFFHTPESNSE